MACGARAAGASNPNAAPVVCPTAGTTSLNWSRTATASRPLTAEPGRGVGDHEPAPVAAVLLPRVGRLVGPRGERRAAAEVGRRCQLVGLKPGQSLTHRGHHRQPGGVQVRRGGERRDRHPGGEGELAGRRDEGGDRLGQGIQSERRTVLGLRGQALSKQVECSGDAGGPRVGRARRGLWGDTPAGGHPQQCVLVVGGGGGLQLGDERGEGRAYRRVALGQLGDDGVGGVGGIGRVAGTFGQHVRGGRAASH